MYEKLQMKDDKKQTKSNSSALRHSSFVRSFGLGRGEIGKDVVQRQINIFDKINQEAGNINVSSFVKWSQEEDGLIGVTSSTSKGVCAAYCLYWLKSMEEGKTKLPDFKTKLDSINTQISFKDKDWKQVFSDKGVDIKNIKTHFLKTNNLEFETKRSSESIKKIIGDIDTSLAIELCLDAGLGTHLIALSTKNENISLFDPNYGVITFNRKYIDLFFEKYLKYFNDEFGKNLVKLNIYQTTGEFNLRPLFS